MGNNPARTNATAGNAARSHSPSEVISNILTDKVSQPNGRVIKVMGISFITSTNTSMAAVNRPPRSIGKCTCHNSLTPLYPKLRAASSTVGVIRCMALSIGLCETARKRTR